MWESNDVLIIGIPDKMTIHFNVTLMEDWIGYSPFGTGAWLHRSICAQWVLHEMDVKYYPKFDSGVEHQVPPPLPSDNNHILYHLWIWVRDRNKRSSGEQRGMKEVMRTWIRLTSWFLVRISINVFLLMALSVNNSMFKPHIRGIVVNYFPSTHSMVPLGESGFKLYLPCWIKFVLVSVASYQYTYIHNLMFLQCYFRKVEHDQVQCILTNWISKLSIPFRFALVVERFGIPINSSIPFRKRCDWK